MGQCKPVRKLEYLRGGTDVNVCWAWEADIGRARRSTTLAEFGRSPYGSSVEMPAFRKAVSTF